MKPRKIKKTSRLFLPLLFLVLLTTFAFTSKARAGGDELRFVIEGLEKKYASISTMSADFLQEAYSISLQSSEHAKGTVSFKKPGMMRWDYFGGGVIVSNGKLIWVYEPELAQVIETKVDPTKPNITTDFLTDVGNLESDFVVKLLSSDEEGYELSLTPKLPMGNTKELRVKIDRDFLLKKTTAIDSFNNETRVEFLGISINTGIPDDTFEYKEQKGIKIIRP